MIKTIIELTQHHFLFADTPDEAQGAAEEIELDNIRTEGADYIDNALESSVIESIGQEELYEKLEEA